MDVRTYMTDKVITVTSDVRVLEALDIMKKHHIRRLPVVQGTKLIGLVTEQGIAESTPSKVSSLSMHELNFLLTKTTIADIMEKKVVTIHPDASLEEAAVTMRTSGVNVLPVIEMGRLVGIITNTDIFDAFVDVLGYHRPGVRVVIEMKDEVGAIENLLREFKDNNMNINQIAAYWQKDTAQVVLQTNSATIEAVQSVLDRVGYRVISIMEKVASQ